MGRPRGVGKSPAADRRLRQLGNAARLLGVRPWEWALCTVEQTDALLDWLDAYHKAQEEAAAKLKRS